MKKCGIYQIRNTINNNIYIGSSRDLTKREKQHFNDLKNNKHSNKHLQYSFNKYGKENFVFEVLEYCTECNQFKIEQIWLNKYYGKNNCYNENPEAINPPHTEQSIAKMKKTKTGKTPWNKGKKDIYSQKTREKISNSLKNRYCGGKNPFATKVYSIKDKKIFNSVVECAKYYNISRDTVIRHCKEKVKKETTKFKYYKQ